MAEHEMHTLYQAFILTAKRGRKWQFFGIGVKEALVLSERECVVLLNMGVGGNRVGFCLR